MTDNRARSANQSNKHKPLSSLYNRPDAIENRLPNAIFTGPIGLYHQRVKQFDYKNEIGIGKYSGLRTFNLDYLSRYLI
jgi:hypothetical protein